MKCAGVSVSKSSKFDVKEMSGREFSAASISQEEILEEDILLLPDILEIIGGVRNDSSFAQNLRILRELNENPG
ncbi:hypothetical protein NPIL_166891 [Nephila pilipes]|uniref:Uncharacterized protein n=1 Tax=Nephila pilipes TaxID=299642 RepID=A0A8X6PQJ2_NEPPI|nr:hypothetical protein NPIL_166891 [Nephila pilipes]